VRCSSAPTFDSDTRDGLPVVVENVERATVYLDFNLWKQSANVNDGLQTVP
jgi:hypothetical protein